jgi:hypothetical protein
VHLLQLPSNCLCGGFSFRYTLCCKHERVWLYGLVRHIVSSSVVCFTVFFDTLSLLPVFVLRSCSTHCLFFRCLLYGLVRHIISSSGVCFKFLFDRMSLLPMFALRSCSTYYLFFRCSLYGLVRHIVSSSGVCFTVLFDTLSLLPVCGILDVLVCCIAWILLGGRQQR